MIILLSPSKTQNFEKNKTVSYKLNNLPFFINESNYLVETLKKLEPFEIQNLMKVSDNIAFKVFNLFLYFDINWNKKEKLKYAIFSYIGDVYKSLDSITLSNKELMFLEKHLRILSGLYGILKPFDLIQQYRLEMKTKINDIDLNIYWKNKVNLFIEKEFSKIPKEEQFIINLASKEYSKPIDKKIFTIINIDFKEYKNGQYKNIGIYAKKARGLMTRFIAKNEIIKIDDLKGFTKDNYKFNNELSKKNHFIFTR